MAEVLVDLAAKSYSIEIGCGQLALLGRSLAGLGLTRRVMIVTNESIFALYGRQVVDGLQQENFTVSVVRVPDGEQAKCLEQAGQLYTRAIEAGLDRKSIIIALGGGVVGDLAGFVAATFQRGIPFVQVPTTLLAQVDSSVGGKVAVNHALGKNLIGAFYQPKLVWTDVETLVTLPERELGSGLAEVIKYGVISDKNLFEFLEQHRDRILARQLPVLQDLVQMCCRIKAMVVNRDEQEHGLRMILNFGHTIGHAVENLGRYQCHNHGEAVAIGMAGAAYLAREMGMLATEDCQRIVALIQRFKLPVTAGQYRADDIIGHLVYDKKNVSGKLHWVLPRMIGTVNIRTDVTHELIKTAWSALHNDWGR